jgi:carbamoyl-phosphate synthase large subunit
VHEVNPRFSGGLPLSLHAGADLVEEYLRGILGLPMRPARLVARPGVTMMRHYSEVFTG